MLAAPVANAQKENHRCNRSDPAFPARVVYGLYVLSPVSGLFSHRPPGLSPEVDPSVGRSGPHDFAVRLSRARQPQPKRPSLPASTSVTTRPPLLPSRDEPNKPYFSEKRKTNI